MIETERLSLREVTWNDKKELFYLHSDPEVQKYTGEPVVTSMEEIEHSIQTRLDDYQEYGFGRLAVIHKTSKAFIGWAGLTYLPEFDVVDLGYRLKKEFWGKGFATEASKACIIHGFETLNLDLIVALAFPDNIGSFNVMKKVGMKFYKHAPYEIGSKDVPWYKIEKADFYEAQ